MPNVNTAVVAGNLSRDPELKFTQGGQAVASFGLAVNRSYKKNDEWVEEVSWINVVCWGTLADNVAQSCQKGMRLIVTGRYQQRSYETNDGEKRNVVELVADDVGPSLCWATAQVDRTERTTSSDREPQRPAPQRQQRRYEDEEPF